MIKATAFVLSTVLFSGLTHAACAKPEAPMLPDAATAVTAQMVKAKNDVQAYMTDANAYLECVKNDKKHNRMVKSMKKIGTEFNVAVRSYKDRMANS
ncbi:MAG: hypothetical protein ACI89U_000883 [Gammaproteobacteria bacterium]|jgi:hypothetical protein